MDDSFLTLAGPGEAETRVRGSRFIAVAFPAREEGEARTVLEERERSLFDASHHCAAWRFRGGYWRALDAGEPSGSAGAPILAAIDALDLLDAAVVVTRYFGGTKLGVGGLVRAYREAAAMSLAEAPKRLGIPATVLSVHYPFELTAPLMRTVERFAAEAIRHGFSEAGGQAEIEFVLPAAEVDGFRAALRDQSAGALAARVERDTVLFRAPPG